MLMGWIVTPVVSKDYAASIGELVRVDMSGKFAPDMVTVDLPPGPSSDGAQSVCVCTTNTGGIEDGAKLKVRAGSLIRPPNSYEVLWHHSEQAITFTWTGDDWQITSGL
jgi:hypothetical protein